MEALAKLHACDTTRFPFLALESFSNNGLQQEMNYWSGFLDYLNLPKEWPPGELPLCPAKLRDKTRGCLSPACKAKKNHKDPDLWSPTLFKFMCDFVDSDKEHLAWNEELVTPEMLKLKYNQSPPDKRQKGGK